MQIKSIAMLVVAGCTIGMLTGCGVPQKEHDAIVAQLTAEAQATQDALNAQLTETQASLDAESAKSSKLQTEVENSVARIDELKGAADDLTASLTAEQDKVAQLDSELAEVKGTIASYQQQTADAESARDAMELEKIETQRRFDMLRKALLDLNKKNPDDLQIKLIVDDMGGAPAAASSGTAAPAASDPESVQGLLDAMDNM